MDFGMEKHLNDILMEIAITVSLSKEKHMVKEFILGKTVKYMGFGEVFKMILT